ncbi:hypothetical protein IWZ00DRAFT_547572 [Phyllosticta capitalensis]
MRSPLVLSASSPSGGMLEVLGGVLLTTPFQEAVGYPNTTITSMITSAKNWIIAGEGVQMIGTIISATSYSYGQLIAGVFLIIPVYVAEMAISVPKRGRSRKPDDLQRGWRNRSGLLVDFGMTFAHRPSPFLLPNPDTPRYYYATGRSAEGDATLSRLYARPLSDAAVARSKGDILASIELEKDFFYDTSDLQAARRIRTGVFLVGIGYMIGTDMIYYYLSTIFQAYIGLPATTASAMSAVATTVLTPAPSGNPSSWQPSPASCPRRARKRAPPPPACSSGGSRVFGPTWGPVPYVYASEVMPLRYRHIGFALSVSAQWLSAFLTTFAGPIAIADASVGWKTWIWFLVFNVVAGPTLEEVDLLFMSQRLQGTSAAKQLEHTASLSSASRSSGDVEDVGAEGSEGGEDG